MPDTDPRRLSRSIVPSRENAARASSASIDAAAGTSRSGSRGRSADEVARAIGFDVAFTTLILDDEVRRGHVERDEAGLYRASPQAVREYAALRFLWPKTEGRA